MYTDWVVRLRSFALVLALFVAATPVIGVVCDLECEPPVTSSGCHDSSAPHDDAAVRGAQHPCDHDDTAGEPALLKSASGRDSVAASVAVSMLLLPHVSVSETRTATAAAMHGPPGLSGRRTPSRTTVLRI
jgi:hypothetical protein